MGTPDYRILAEHYERCFDAHGRSAKGADWPDPGDADVRYAVMLDLCRGAVAGASLLDLGCGFGLLADHLQRRGLLPVCGYRGIDLSEKLVREARSKHPDLAFEARDVLQHPLAAKSADYVLLNGVLTEKVSLTQDRMEAFARSIIAAAFAACRIGIAFNVMSEHVDWKRDDLFYWPYDRAAEFLVAHCSRHFVFRSDYGLYEYTAYVYREPNRSAPRAATPARA